VLGAANETKQVLCAVALRGQLVEKAPDISTCEQYCSSAVACQLRFANSAGNVGLGVNAMHRR
jgi:hypothetical protein